MVLIKVETVFKEKGVKPTRFRFKNSIRLGFKGKKVVEVTKFKNVKR
ncbi:hypothetical protein LCGC14_0571350 [marine sediment metagenome]|uniref:Uncharacterized protein n=1 Tax=marine sediment metagenome TaxID=412755 RepID=A0A0F9S2U3_9ZZZZ